MGNGVKRNRPDHDGTHRLAFDRNKRKIMATETVCGICGQPVDKMLKYPHPMSPCIDHIIPIDRGGHPSDIANLQLAHWKCNRAKSNKLIYPAIHPGGGMPPAAGATHHTQGTPGIYLAGETPPGKMPSGSGCPDNDTLGKTGDAGYKNTSAGSAAVGYPSASIPGNTNRILPLSMDWFEYKAKS